MWKPDESLDDYIVSPAEVVDAEAPHPVSLGGTGEFEVLKPLAGVRVPAEPRRFAFKAPYQPLWFRRFVAVGSGALVMTAFVLVSAILFGIEDRTDVQGVVTNERPEGPSMLPEEPFTFGVSSFVPAAGVVDVVRSNARRGSARPTIRLVVKKPKRHLRRRLQPEDPTFVPTTLVIYAKNGVINTRIEPWFQDGDKKTTTFDN